MDTDKEKLDKFLDAGVSYFETQRWPEVTPAFIAQIPEAIKAFKDSIEKSTAASDNLTESIVKLTRKGVTISVIAVIISVLVVLLEMYKIFLN